MQKIVFDEKINKLRFKRKMTQGELGNMLGVSNKTISKWEMGVSLPDIETLVKLAEFFNISLDELVLNKKNCYNVSAKDDKMENTKKTNDDIIKVILASLSLAMGICVIVTFSLGKISIPTSLIMLSLGIVSLSLYLLRSLKK